MQLHQRACLPSAMGIRGKTFSTVQTCQCEPECMCLCMLACANSVVCVSQFVQMSFPCMHLIDMCVLCVYVCVYVCVCVMDVWLHWFACASVDIYICVCPRKPGSSVTSAATLSSGCMRACVHVCVRARARVFCY